MRISVITTEKILLEFDPEKRNLLPALKKVSAAFGYISELNAQKTADYFKLPLSKVYETASFYDQINVEKKADLVIQICSSPDCALGGSLKIVKEIENYFRIKAGSDSNPKIKLEMISCLGRCGEGPIMTVGDKVYTNVTKSSIYGILEKS